MGYGKNLQEFLLNYVPIIAIYDNPKRSFTHADVNTVITLFGAPVNEELIPGEMKDNAKDNPKMLNHTAKFIMFKKPFESVANAKNLIEIENIEVKRGDQVIELVNNVVKTSDYRVFPVVQEDLLNDGWKYPKNYDIKKGYFKAGSYEANKWGGKFLRAPDIFYTILKNGKNKLIKLGDISEIKFGIKSGANDFFYLPSKYFDIKEETSYYTLIPKKDDLPNNLKIEKKFLKPVIKSPRECKSTILNPEKLKYKIFICHDSKKDLKNTKVISYINWGETKTTDQGVFWSEVPSVRSRKRWYELTENENYDLIIPRTFNEVYTCHMGGFNFSDRFYGINTKNKNKLCLFLSSSIFVLFSEALAKQSLGLGALDLNIIELNKIPSLFKPEIESFNKEFINVFEECGINPKKPIREQDPAPLPERLKLDNIIFNELELNEKERKEVYWSVCELVKQRLEKAKSLRG